jgi:hypothetical protein
MHHTMALRRATLVRLNATIVRTEQRVRWRRFILRIAALLGRDASQAGTALRRAEYRLASLHRDRRFLFGLHAR